MPDNVWANPQGIQLITNSTIKLGLFLSRATPLHRWHRSGVFGREIALYMKLREQLGRIDIVSSGGEEELGLLEHVEGIGLLCNRWRLTPNTYSLLAPFLHRKRLRELDVYKSNQLDGAWTAVVAGRLYRKPVIVRAGYMWAELHRRQSGAATKAGIIDALQMLSIRLGSHIVVTTEVMKQQVIAKYRVNPEKVSVVPNYVDTGRHRPDDRIGRQPGRICYVGRLDPIKNLATLVEATCGIANASLVLVGDGEQRNRLESLANELGVEATFLGVLSNENVSEEINRSELFVLPSHTEGHPKALLEAMACGATVLGSDVPGIRDVVTHGENGWLCEPEIGPMRDAIRYLLSEDELRQRLGANARHYVERSYSLDRVSTMELLVYQATVRV